MIKSPTILEIDGNSLLCKKVSVNPTANIIVNGKLLRTLPLRMRTRNGCLLSPLLVITVLAIAIRQGKKKVGKKPLNCHFPDDVINK